MRVVISGYRYYSSELGRWLNRDPLRELGSMILRRKIIKNDINEELNLLYAFVNNDPNNRIDRLGLDLILVGEGGSSGQMFLLAAQTWASRNAGDHIIVSVSTGQAAIDAMKEYKEDKCCIDGLQIFAHSGNYGIFFSQSPGARSLYTNMPRSFRSGAAAISQIDASWFCESTVVKLWGCNTAWGTDSFAQQLANEIGQNVIGSTGPTAFSGVEDGLPGQGLPEPVPSVYNDPVFMVPQYHSQGYIEIAPEGTSWFDNLVRSIRDLID